MMRLARSLAAVYSRQETGRLMTKARFCSLRSLMVVTMASCAPTPMMTMHRKDDAEQEGDLFAGEDDGQRGEANRDGAEN